MNRFLIAIRNFSEIKELSRTLSKEEVTLIDWNKKIDGLFSVFYNYIDGSCQ